MFVIGLTGGIGSGKTTVAELFFSLGVPVIDTDQIAHRLTEKGQPALSSIRKQFGDQIFHSDGSLNRQALAKQIFNDEQARQQLQTILHPAIWREVEAQLQVLNADYCLVVIPLLLETGNQERVDRILVVDTTEELQLSRTRQRDQRSDDDIRAILASQVDRRTRLKQADDIIDNTANPGEPLVLQVNKLHQKYQQLARH